MSELFDLCDQAALITGSSRGIGRAIAERMAEAGARVTISSRKADVCQLVTEEINQRFGMGTALSAPCNIDDRQQLQSLVDTTREQLGPIDILVCNAAVNPNFGPSLGISDEAYEKILRCNVLANHWLCQMVLPEMQARGKGRVIVVSSITGLAGQAELGAYGISKAATMQMVRNLAREYGRYGITVNAIAPGMIKTDFSRALWEDEASYKRICAAASLRRGAEPDEVAGAAIFLAAKSGSFVTGQSLVVDGGVLV